MMKKNNVKLFVELMFFLLSIAIANTIFANDDIGRIKAEECVSCHGPEGKSDLDIWPNLAGQKQAYFILQLTAFREGKRYDPWMSPMATDLTDKDIEALAIFYSNL